MPVKRALRSKATPQSEDKITSSAASIVSNGLARSSRKRKAEVVVELEDEDDLNLFDVPDSEASLLSTPISTRQKFSVEVTPAMSTTASTSIGSTTPADDNSFNTPATSVTGDDDKRSWPGSSRREVRAAAAAARQKSFKIESDVELSELSDVVTDFDETESEDLESIADSEDSIPLAKSVGNSRTLKGKAPKRVKVQAVRHRVNASDQVEFPTFPVTADNPGDAGSPVDHSETRSIEEDFDEDADTSTRVNGRSRRRPRSSQYEKTMEKLIDHHPELATVWQDLESRDVIVPAKAAQPEILTLKLLPFQLEGLNWLRRQEDSTFRGGILADEMGMGKTIQTVAMLVSDTSRDKDAGEAGTLVVAPTVALMQWKSEILKYTNNALDVHIYHGSNRELSAKKLKEHDVILTTYNLLESVWRKQQSGFTRKNGIVKEKSMLHSIKFHRIVLDEAHNIKDRSCGTARAVFNLQTDRRWCLSGTPLQNRVGELFSLLRFLQTDPFSFYYCKKCPCKSLHWKFSDKRTCDDCHHRPMDHTCWFNHELLKPIQRFGAQGEGLAAFKKIHKLLARIMLRRTKIERADDMGLPPRVVTVRRDLFNDEEEDLYDSLYSDSKRKFDTYADEGTVLNNYANIFQLITRMRQMADHPDLILKRQGEVGINSLVCKICDETSEDAIKAKCHHIFCRACIEDYMEAFIGGAPKCPVCHLTLSIDLSAPALETANEDLIKKSSILNRIDMSKWRSSTKIEALVEELYKLRAKDSTIKSIVFSQWTSFLELVNWRLRRAGFSCCKLDGTMTPEARANTINHFSNDPSVTVFLVSLKAGGVALNLTEASVVFLSDPWWNPSAEWQAADRVHRLGQRRPVRITRLVIENSIESRIIELQQKKADMINSTIDGDDASMNRLSVQDMSFLFQS